MMMRMMTKHITPEEGKKLVQDGSVRVTQLGEAKFEFLLNDNRKVQFEVSGYTEGCDTCGWGAEPIVYWTLVNEE